MSDRLKPKPWSPENECGMGAPLAEQPCEHDMVVLCFEEGWFCMECKKIVDHDCGYKETEYRYGITGYRVRSEIGHTYGSKYVR